MALQQMMSPLDVSVSAVDDIVNQRLDIIVQELEDKQIQYERTRTKELQLCEKEKQKEIERIAQEAKEELEYLKEKIRHETQLASESGQSKK